MTAGKLTTDTDTCPRCGRQVESQGLKLRRSVTSRPRRLGDLDRRLIDVGFKQLFVGRYSGCGGTGIFAGVRNASMRPLIFQR
jgi:hypothetical protein